MSRVILKDQVWRNLKKNLKNGPHAKVGVLAGAPPHDGIAMAELAAIHEFGSPKAGVPERSFIRSTFRENRAELRSLAGKLARRILGAGKGTRVRGMYTVEQALDVLGQWGASKVHATIQAGVKPANAPETIRRKKSSKPLVDHGLLKGAITYKVEPK